MATTFSRENQHKNIEEQKIQASPVGKFFAGSDLIVIFNPPWKYRSLTKNLSVESIEIIDPKTGKIIKKIPNHYHLIHIRDWIINIPSSFLKGIKSGKYKILIRTKQGVTLELGDLYLHPPEHESLSQILSEAAKRLEGLTPEKILEVEYKYIAINRASFTPDVIEMVKDPQKILEVLAKSNNPEQIERALKALELYKDAIDKTIIETEIQTAIRTGQTFIFRPLGFSSLFNSELVSKSPAVKTLYQAGKIIAERAKKDVNFARLVAKIADEGYPTAYWLAKHFGAIREKDVSGNMTRILIYVAGHEKPIGEWYRESINEGGKLRLFSWSSSEGEEQALP